MIFGRKRKADSVDKPDDELAGAEELVASTVEPGDEVAEQAAEPDADGVAYANAADPKESALLPPEDELPPELRESETAEEADPADGDSAADEQMEDVDWRADGPFDFEEVDLTADEVERLDLGSLILTPWEGMGLQLQVNEATQQVVAALAFWEQSGLELALLAAPTSGGLADEIREDLTEEAEQAGGSSSTARGPFGHELRRVLPVEGPAGEQMFQVSRTWFAEGPRWLLRGTLLGEAGLTEEDEQAAAPFVEFFRNVVVRRGESPMVPGEVIAMTMPTAPQA